MHCILFSLSQCRCRRFACFCLGWLLLVPAPRKYFIQIDELTSVCVWSVDFGGAQRVTLHRNKKTLNKVAFSRRSSQQPQRSNRLNMQHSHTHAFLSFLVACAFYFHYIYFWPPCWHLHHVASFFMRVNLFSTQFIYKKTLSALSLCPVALLQQRDASSGSVERAYE